MSAPLTNARGIPTAHGVARYSRIIKLSDFPPVRGRRGIKFQTAWLECGHLHESDAAERRRGEVYCGGCYDGRPLDFDPTIGGVLAEAVKK